MPRIKIENKHTYFGVNSTIDGNVLIPDSTTVRETNTLFRYFEPSYPVQGTDENDRIGRKIMTTSLVLDGFINLRTGNVPNGLGDTFDGFISDLKLNANWAENYELDPEMFVPHASIRHMIVEFDPDVITGSNANKYDTFRRWFISLNIQTGTDLMPSNRTTVKRESTEFTGKYKILHDDVYYLTFKSNQIHFNIVQPYKRYLNFDSTTEQTSPTGRRLFVLFIGPTNTKQDYSSPAFGDFLNNTAATENAFVLRLAKLDFTMKLNYVDI